jgi:predicted dehydrogenase
MHFTRRDFAKLGALGLAAHFVPALSAQATAANSAGNSASSAADSSAGRKIGYAVIGLGRIAGHFMPACWTPPTRRSPALVSGHRDKAERIAAQYGVPSTSIYSYENFDEIAHNPAIDAVYVALPNSMHAEYTIRAAKAGKHVLCEKPMSTNVAEAEAMIAACKAANVKLMIAYRCHYEPTNLRAVKLIRDGALGQVQAIESAFGYNSGPGEWRLNKKLAGGGPLFDVGIYSLNACRYLTGEEPEHFAAFASTIDRDGRFNEVEENLSWTMRFPSGIVAACNTTYGAPMERLLSRARIEGLASKRPGLQLRGPAPARRVLRHNSTNPTRPATLRTSWPKPSTSPATSRDGTGAERLPAKKACATCATSLRSTAPPGSRSSL